MPSKTAPKKILITGGSGFVGRNVIDLLQDITAYQIDNLGRTPLEGIRNVHNIKCDAATFDFTTLSDDYDVIIHLLALSNEQYCQDFPLAEAVNIGFTKSVLQFAERQRNLEKLVYLSSIIMYDNADIPPVLETGPLYLNYTTYSFTKGIAEAYVNFYCEKRGLPVVIFRLSNIYGPFQDFVDSPFLVPSKIVEGLDTGKITVFNLEPRRDWIYSGDVAEAIVMSMEKKGMSGIYNLAGGKSFSVREIISEIASQLGVPYGSLDKPTTGPHNFYCDISKIQNDLNWYPKINLSDGVRKTISFITDSQKRNIQ